MKLIKIILLPAIILCTSLSALAELPERIKADFSPLSGVIIMPIGEEFLIDLDTSVDLKEGDILTLTAPGEKVIHPVSKEVLGTLDEVRGYLQVTQVKSGYSYAKVIAAQTAPQKGDQVKRFEQVPALIDQTLAASTLAAELRNGLPQLKWLGKEASQVPLLTFGLSNNRLNITNSEGVVVKTYQYSDNTLSAPSSLSYREDNFSLGGIPEKNKSRLNQSVDNLLGAIGIGGNKDQRLENPGIIRTLQQQNSAVWMGPNLDGNPVGLAVGDFDGDGTLETAVAMEDHLQIHRLSEGQLKQIAVIDFPGGVHLLSLDAVDLNNNGLPELYLSANVGEKLSSQIVEFTPGGYKRIENRIPWFFRVVDLPHEGPTLVAQTMGEADNPFSGGPFRVSLEDGHLARGPELPLPGMINLFSFAPLIETNDERLYATVSTSDFLSVSTTKGTILWEAGDRYGGTEVFFYNVENIDKELIQPVYIQQRLVRLPGGDILVPQNDGIRTFQRFRNFTKSRVIAMKWDGFALTESWRTTDQNGYLADYALADADNDGRKELAMVIKYSQKNLLQKGRSTIVIYELEQ